MWSDDIEKILDDVRTNAVYLSNFHKSNYFYFKRVSNYFRVPTIMLSSIASVASVGLTAYVNQRNISGIVCLMSLTIGIINSIELYLRIQDNLELELATSKSYYNLSIDIHKVLNLSENNRDGEPRQILDEYYKRYVDLVQESNLLSTNYPDKLSKIPKIKRLFNTQNVESPIIRKALTSAPSPTSSSSSSINSNPLDDSPEAHL
tara:strand:- start:618 stop:1232 length:615 start_codon:yes stop_codon:yes gene_type:complete